MHMTTFQLPLLENEIKQILIDGAVPNNTYHNLRHVIRVQKDVMFLARQYGLDDESCGILSAAALLHDIGLLDGDHRHEERSARMATTILPNYGFTAYQVGQIVDMINSTVFPQKPKDFLSELLCDADLFYLGTNEYDQIAYELRLELEMKGQYMSDLDWMRYQINFLENHHYFTLYGQEYLEPRKQAILKELRIKLKLTC